MMNGFEDFAKKKKRIPVHPCCDSSPRMSTQTKREGWGKCKDYLTCTLYVSFYFIMHFISCRRTHRALSFPSLRVPLLLRSGTRGASCGTGAGNGVCERERERERGAGIRGVDWGGVVQQASYTGVTKDDGELINSRATRRLRVRPLESGSDSSRTSARHRDTAHPHMRR